MEGIQRIVFEDQREEICGSSGLDILVGLSRLFVDLIEECE